MSAAIKDYPVPPHVRVARKAQARWLEIKGWWTLRCPQCQQAWIVVGVKAGDEHKCKSCHFSFVVEVRR